MATIRNHGIALNARILIRQESRSTPRMLESQSVLRSGNAQHFALIGAPVHSPKSFGAPRKAFRGPQLMANGGQEHGLRRAGLLSDFAGMVGLR